MDCALVRACVTGDFTLVVQEHRARLMGSIKTWRDLARQGNAHKLLYTLQTHARLGLQAAGLPTLVLPDLPSAIQQYLRRDL